MSSTLEKENRWTGPDWEVEDDPRLPRVLLLGDSISISYTRPVRALLKGKANVHRPLESPASPANCGATRTGLANLHAWLGDKPWDVIHFNWGLHDLMYVNEQGKLAAPDGGKINVPIDQYERNLEELVGRLKVTGAKLIFATTTPVPEGAAGRLEADAPRYNQRALAVMRRNQVRVNDLYSFALPRLKELQRERNVHFHERGAQALAEPVAANILSLL
ncbi:MAG: SGNH/GDSL hydrolase family protein [Verrucomicrobia bacterium]|nr:SGNH/GDSL hydrolase family protein [Verrucomicrobiota bacterium]